MQPAHSVSDQISASANRFPGDGRHWDLGDSRTEPSVTGRSDRTLLLIGKREGIKAPNSPAQECLLFTAPPHSGPQETLSRWILSCGQPAATGSAWMDSLRRPQHPREPGRRPIPTPGTAPSLPQQARNQAARPVGPTSQTWPGSRPAWTVRRISA